MATTKGNTRDDLNVRASRVATTATMVPMPAQTLGAGKTWG